MKKLSRIGLLTAAMGLACSGLPESMNPTGNAPEVTTQPDNTTQAPGLLGGTVPQTDIDRYCNERADIIIDFINSERMKENQEAAKKAYREKTGNEQAEFSDVVKCVRSTASAICTKLENFERGTFSEAKIGDQVGMVMDPCIVPE